MTTDTYADPQALLTSGGGATEAQRKMLRAKCRQSLYFLCKAILGFKDFTPGLHLEACNFVQDQSAERKLLMLPRSFFKSYLATIGYTIWLLIQEDDGKNFRGAQERILIANATASNAEQFLSKIKSVFERNDLFKWLFPELIPDFTSKDLRWNIQAITIPRQVDFPEPTISTIGVGGAVVSRHYTRIILDDLINDQHAMSPELMRKAIEWYKYAESLLEVSSANEMLVIGTRWAFNDLYSYIEENEGEWDALNQPLGFKKHIRHAIENDQPIFPERFPFAELSRLRNKLGNYMFSCLYLNDPRQPGVNDFDTNWLKHYKFGDKGNFVLDDGRLVDPLTMDRVLIVDIATTVRRDADFSAIICVGVDPARRVFILEAWHARVNTKHLLDKIFSLAARWRVRAAFYEDSAQQKLIEFAIQQHSKETGQYLQVFGVKAGNKQSKEQRIRMVSEYFQKGNVYIRQSMSDFVNEYADFPLGKHDDLLDAFAYFPRCVRFSYDDVSENQVSEDPDEQEERVQQLANQFEMEAFLTGRSRVTGY